MTNSVNNYIDNYIEIVLMHYFVTKQDISKQ